MYIYLTHCCIYAIMCCMRNRKETIETTNPAPMIIHNRLAVLRAERGLSRQELAAAVGVNYQTIGYLERGDYSPSLELAFRLSDYFGLPIEFIFARQPFKPLSKELYGSTVQTNHPGGHDA